MNSTLDLGYSTSVTRTYWCHICKREFSRIFIENVDVTCRICGSNFCEELESNNNESDHPSNFEPYQNTTTNLTLNNGVERNSGLLNMIYAPRNRPRTTSSFLDMIVNILGMNNHDDTNMESIISYIMQNDTNRYGNPPASKMVLDNLEKLIVNDEYLIKLKEMKCEHNCSVCKDEFEINQTLINLPCKHSFHDECITPWLKERNSCPTCRFELPTDDPDYEKRKNSV